MNDSVKMYVSYKVTVYSLSLFSFLFYYFYKWQESVVKWQKWQEPNSTCRLKILETQKYLEVDNVTFSCEALESKGCEKTHQR